MPYINYATQTPIIIIGRHAVQGLPAEFVPVEAEPRNITFPATSAECMPIIRQLLAEAGEWAGGRVLFQNLPGQVAAACCIMLARDGGGPGRGGFADMLGVIINTPVQADEGSGVRRFQFSHIEWL